MLHGLRQQSEKTRSAIVLIVALTVTLIIAVFWFWSSIGRFQTARKELPKESSPFSIFRANVKDAVDTFRSAEKDDTSLFAPLPSEGGASNTEARLPVVEIVQETALPAGVPRQENE